MRDRLKIIAVVLLVVLTVVVVLQNTEPVPTEIVFVTVTMPLAALLFATAAVGFVLGLVLANRLQKGKGKGKPPPSERPGE